MNNGAGHSIRTISQRFGRWYFWRAALCCSLFSAWFSLSSLQPAYAQATPAFVAPSAYDMQPGSVPIAAVTGVFNNAGGFLDFAVLEQVSNTGVNQVEIFHGNSNGTFCTNCTNASPDPDLIPLSTGVTGNALAVGQFRTSTGFFDIAVATSSGIVFLQNNGTGTFTTSSNAISSGGGFVALVVGLFNGDSNYDIAAVGPISEGGVTFIVYFGDGTGAFPPSSSSPYSVSNTYTQCGTILQGNFQSQTTQSDLALVCGNPSEVDILTYLNSLNGSGNFAPNQTLVANNEGITPAVAVGTLNSEAAFFVASSETTFLSYEGNGGVGGNNNFSSVSLIPVGSAPQGSIAVLYDPPTGAVDFAVENNGVSLSTFTSYTQAPTSPNVNGTWNSTVSLGPGTVLAVGYSPSLTQGPTYVVINAGVDYPQYGEDVEFSFVDERSVNVFLATLNTSGTVAATNTAPDYVGTGANGYQFPPSFATGDFNGDGVLDLAVAGADDAEGNATLTIYLANSNGSIPITTSLPVIDVSGTEYTGVDAVVAGTFRPAQTGHTLPYYDLAIFSSNAIFIYTSNGDGTFTAGDSYSLEDSPGYPGFDYNPAEGGLFAPVLTAADVNGDGRTDLVLTLPEDQCGDGSPSQGAVYVLISNGDGSFQTPVFVAPPVVNPVSVAAAKFYGSALPDLVFADGGELCGSGNTATTTGTAVGILHNTSGTFTPGPAIVTQTSDLDVPNVTAVASADMNGDGQPDLIVSNTNGIQVLLNQGGGSFAPTAQGVLPLYAGDVIPGPLCNDGDNDMGCVTYDSQVITGSFFALGENDVAVSVAGVAYVFQNPAESGILSTPTQGFVAGPNSTMMSASLTNPAGLDDLLVATSQGAAFIANTQTGAPIVVLAPTSLTFASQTLGTTSASQPIMLSNTGNATLSLDSITITGPNASEFNLTDGCSASVPANSACTINVTFTPTAAGNATASVNFADNAAGSPQTVPLTGVGAQSGAPVVSLSPPTLTFNGQAIGSPASQPTTLSNTGTAVLVINSIAITGADAEEFTQTNTCGEALAANASCTITVTFTPTTIGSATASVSINDNAAGSPQTVPLPAAGAPFSLTTTCTSLSVVPGQTAVYTVDLAAVGEFTPTVALSCSGAPTLATCTPASTSMNLSGTTPVQVQVTATTTQATGSLRSPFGRANENRLAGILGLGGIAGLAALIMLPGKGRGKPGRRKTVRRLYGLIILICILAALATLPSCGGVTDPPGTASGTYPLTVTGTFQPPTGAPITETVTFNLVVQ